MVDIGGVELGSRRLALIVGVVSLSVLAVSVAVAAVVELSAGLAFVSTASIRSGIVFANALFTSMRTLALVVMYYVMAETQKSQLRLAERLNSPRLTIPAMSFVDGGGGDGGGLGEDRFELVIENHGQEPATDLHFRVDGEVNLGDRSFEFVDGVELPIDGGIEVTCSMAPLREQAGGDLALDSISSGGAIAPNDRKTFRSTVHFLKDGEILSGTELLDLLREHTDGVFLFQFSLVFRNVAGDVQVKPFQQGHLIFDEEFQWEELEMSTFAEAVSGSPTQGGAHGWWLSEDEILERIERGQRFATGAAE